MMENQSRQTAEITLQEVKLDLIKRGWFVSNAPEEAPYDLAVDLGLDEKNERIWYTVQVKTDLRTTSRPSEGKDEPVSSNGKNRNSYYYFDKDITLLATYDFKKQRVIYIHKNDYGYLKPGKLKKANEYNFPINENMTPYRKNNSTIKPIDIFEVSE
tara:strand:- start:8 stop:478 length:471 start_codon:yes stop_codon:yes gene_type:complete